jgi:hypothetical protein
VAVELSRDSALALIETIQAALASGDAAHAKTAEAKCSLVGSHVAVASLF